MVNAILFSVVGGERKGKESGGRRYVDEGTLKRDEREREREREW